MALIDKLLNIQGLGHFWNHAVAKINKHIENTDNPHKVTLAKLGFSAPDYDQYDSNALDFIKNKPFYSERTVLFDDKGKEYEFNDVSIDFDLEVGKTYAITMNGTEYSSVCELSEYNGNEAKKLAFSIYSIYCTNGKLYANFNEYGESLKIDLKIELEDIKKLDKKYLPDDIGGGGVGKDGKSAYEYAKEAGYEGTEEEFAEKLAVNPDWIASKKVDGGEETYISQQTLTSGLWSGLQMHFQVGLTYDVYFNGEIYPCVAGNEDGGIYLGNITLMNSDSKKEHNDEPFCIYWAGAGATGGFFYKKSTVSYPITLKVTSHADYVYNKMPKEYLPDGVAFKSDIPEGGGASIDVTAEVGQTIIVKEVDANGKPTKWESADYQPRTHWEEKAEIFPETEGVFLEDYGGFFYQDLVFASNITYFITYNGTEYTCTAFEINGMVSVGNLGMMDETFPNTGEPFLVASGAELGGSIFMPLDGAETVKAAIAESKPVKIPPKYIPTLEDMRTEEVVLFNEDIYEGYIGDVDINLTVGETYKINLGGAEYSCVALDATSMGAPGGIVMGNIDLAMGTGDSGDPFVLSYVNRELNVQMVDGSSLDGQMTKITIKGNVYTPIPKKYLANAFPYYIEVSGSGTTDDPYTCNETYDEITELFSSGKDIRIRRKMYNGDGSLLGETIYFYNWSMAFTYRFDNIMTGGWATDPFYININPGERTFTINDSMAD